MASIDYPELYDITCCAVAKENADYCSRLLGDLSHNGSKGLLKFVGQRLLDRQICTHVLIKLMQQLDQKEQRHLIPTLYHVINEGCFTYYEEEDLANLLSCIHSSTLRKFILSKVEGPSPFETLQNAANHLIEAPTESLPLGGKLRQEIYAEMTHRNNTSLKALIGRFFLKTKMQALRVDPINQAIIKWDEAFGFNHRGCVRFTSDSADIASLKTFNSGTFFSPTSSQQALGDDNQSFQQSPSNK